MSQVASVTYRLPDETEIFSFSGIEESDLAPETISKAEYFVYAPFALTPAFSGFKINATPSFVLPPLPEYTGVHQSYTREEYIALVNETVSRIKSGLFVKVVHSRFQFFQTRVNPVDIFNALLKKFPSAFVYLLHSPTWGTWCGATPETLVTRKKNKARTMALAGTRKTSDNHQSWSGKDKEEQQVVADLIREKLNKHHLVFTESETYTRVSGAVSHVCSDFDIELPADQWAITLATWLHPTPAVCGYPTHEAFMRIYGVEKQTRQLYAGMIGQTGGKEKDDLFVNLRCMRVYANGVCMHAGGGINAGSVGEKEWDETVLKMKNVLQDVVPI